MPSYNASHRNDSSTSKGAIAKQSDKAMPSPVTPAVTGIMYPSPLEAPTEVDPGRYRAVYTTDRSSLHPSVAEFSVDESVQPPGDTSLDLLWDTLRQKKERKLAKERPKVQSLEEAANEVHAQDQPSIDIPVFESQASVPKNSLKKQKSITSFRESTDGRSIVATFDLPREVEKQDVHVSFQRNRLVITWEIIEITEWEEDGCLMRDRLEQMFHRTLPLPEGTRFEEINGLMNGRRLILRYPNMRCLRVETRSRSGES